MTLMALLVAVVVLGLLAWLVQMLPLPAPFKQIALVVLILIAILWILQSVGVFSGNLGRLRVG